MEHCSIRKQEIEGGTKTTESWLFQPNSAEVASTI